MTTASPGRFYLLVAGPRVATLPEHRALVRRHLDEILDRQEPLTVVEGGCPTGPDTYAREWAVERQATGRDVLLETYPAPWEIPALKKAAGPARYGYMIGLLVGRAVRCGALVYTRPGSSGSAGTAAFAHHAGMFVREEPI